MKGGDDCKEGIVHLKTTEKRVENGKFSKGCNAGILCTFVSVFMQIAYGIICAFYDGNASFFDRQFCKKARPIRIVLVDYGKLYRINTADCFNYIIVLVRW